MEGGKPENPEKNPQSKDENQQQTRPTCDQESNPGHRDGRRALSPLCHPSSPTVSRYFEQFREQRHAKSNYFGTSVSLSDAILRSFEGNSIRHRDLTLEVCHTMPRYYKQFSHTDTGHVIQTKSLLKRIQYIILWHYLLV